MARKDSETISEFESSWRRAQKCVKQNGSSGDPGYLACVVTDIAAYQNLREKLATLPDAQWLTPCPADDEFTA